MTEINSFDNFISLYPDKAGEINLLRIAIRKKTFSAFYKITAIEFILFVAIGYCIGVIL